MRANVAAASSPATSTSVGCGRAAKRAATKNGRADAATPSVASCPSSIASHTGSSASDFLSVNVKASMSMRLLLPSDSAGAFVQAQRGLPLPISHAPPRRTGVADGATPPRCALRRTHEKPHKRLNGQLVYQEREPAPVAVPQYPVVTKLAARVPATAPCLSRRPAGRVFRSSRCPANHGVLSPRCPAGRGAPSVAVSL